VFLALPGTRVAETLWGTGYLLVVRRIALAGVLIAVIAGCGGQTKTVTGVGSAPAATAAPSTTSAASPLPGMVTSRVERSVLPVSCSSSNALFGFEGTGFRVRTGVVTASHVLAACPPATTIRLGDGIGTVSSNDPTYDLALVTYQSPEFPQNSRNPNPKPLQPESRPAYVGEPLALLGIPALPLLGNPFTPQVTVVQGIVVATNHPQVLTSADAPETLTDTIQVACPDVSSGESGGPAVDSAGKVVGVIEGSGSGIATLTPVTDLTSPH
jgi:S1-C subfamily serine protease